MSNVQPHVSCFSRLGKFRAFLITKTVLLENLFHLSDGKCREVDVYDYIVSNGKGLICNKNV